MSALIVIGIVVLALMGTPLFAIIGLAGLVAYHYADLDSVGIFIELYRVASSPTLIAIPLFTFAGFIMAESKTPQRLTRISHCYLGGVPGGVPVAVLVACAFFTAFTGASGVTIIALGGLLYPLMLKEQYSKDFSLGLMTSSGSLGLLFPPSLPLILYGLVSQVSINELFIAGFIPGMLMIGLLSLYSMWMNLRFKIKRVRFNSDEACSSLRDAVWEVPLPFLIILGIFFGLFSVTEAAAITVIYVLIIECWVYKDIHPLKDLPRIMKSSMVLVGTILIILGTAMGFTNFLVDEQVPMQVLKFLKEYIDDQLTFLIVLNILLLIVGCMMDIFSAIIVVLPLVLPIAKSFDVNMVHLGVIFLTNLEIGYSTPPVGINLFIASSRFSEPVLRLYRATLPFLGLRLAGLLIITYFPALSLYLLQFFQT